MPDLTQRPRGAQVLHGRALGAGLPVLPSHILMRTSSSCLQRRLRTALGPCPPLLCAGRQLPAGCWEEILAGLRSVEEEMGCRLGDAAAPLLLSVRSGAAVRPDRS